MCFAELILFKCPIPLSLLCRIHSQKTVLNGEVKDTEFKLVRLGLTFMLVHFRCPHHGYWCVNSLPVFPLLSKEKYLQDSCDLYEYIYFMVRWSVAQKCHFLAGKQINSLAQCPNFNKWIALLEVNLPSLHTFGIAITMYSVITVTSV